MGANANDYANPVILFDRYPDHKLIPENGF